MEEPLDKPSTNKPKKSKNIFRRFFDTVLDVLSAIGDVFGSVF